MTYLYNGVELPDINTVWTDKETYPWAGIAYFPSTSTRNLFISTARFVANSTTGYYLASEDCTYLQYSYDEAANSWVYDTTFTVTSGETLAPFSAVELGWCNGADLVDEATGSIYLAASEPAPVTYLYNGVELPNINMVWTDKESYPYAAITTDETYQYRLWLSGVGFECMETWSGFTDVVSQESSAVSATYVLESDSWSKDAEYDDRAGRILSGNNGRTTIWTSVDILYVTAGTVYLAASDPVDPNAPTEPETPAFTLDLNSWLTGFALGLCGKPLPFANKTEEPEKTLVGYSYNGVQLPDINTVWTDKTTYPYAVICSGDLSDFGALLGLDISGPMWDMSLLDQKPYCLDSDTIAFNADWNSKNCTLILDADACAAINAAAGADVILPGVWFLMGENTDQTYETCYLPADGLFWTSHDILNADGTTYLAASDPVPVYE